MSNDLFPFVASFLIDGDLVEVTIHHDPKLCDKPDDRHWQSKCPACRAYFLEEHILDLVTVAVHLPESNGEGGHGETYYAEA